MSNILSLEEAKEYLHCDDTTDGDSDIQELIDTAEKYLLNAGCTLNQGDPVAKLAEKMLVNRWYEQRDPVLVGSISKKLEYGLQCLIIQLQNCYSTDTSTGTGETP